MRSEKDIREDIWLSDLWYQAFINCKDFLWWKPFQDEKRRGLFNELLNRQMNYFEDD